MVQRVVSVRKRLCTESTKIVLITNATMLHVKRIQNSLETMLKNNGEIWAKLDAGTSEYFQKIARSSIPYEKILSNLSELTKKIPVVIQSCFLSIHGQIPDESEIVQYAQRLISLRLSGNNFGGDKIDNNKIDNSKIEGNKIDDIRIGDSRIGDSKIECSSNIIRVQMYTVARNTPELWATPLSNEQLDSIAEIVSNLTGLQVNTFYSS
jgi:hypothetical protein